MCSLLPVVAPHRTCGPGSNATAHVRTIPRRRSGQTRNAGIRGARGDCRAGHGAGSIRRGSGNPSTQSGMSYNHHAGPGSALRIGAPCRTTGYAHPGPSPSRTAWPLQYSLPSSHPPGSTRPYPGPVSPDPASPAGPTSRSPAVSPDCRALLPPFSPPSRSAARRSARPGGGPRSATPAEPPGTSPRPPAETRTRRAPAGRWRPGSGTTPPGSVGTYSWRPPGAAPARRRRPASRAVRSGCSQESRGPDRTRRNRPGARRVRREPVGARARGSHRARRPAALFTHGLPGSGPGGRHAAAHAVRGRAVGPVAAAADDPDEEDEDLAHEGDAGA